MQFFNVCLMKFLSSSFGESLAFTVFVCHTGSRLPITLWISATTNFWTNFSWGDINTYLFIPDSTSITDRRMIPSKFNLNNQWAFWDGLQNTGKMLLQDLGWPPKSWMITKSVCNHSWWLQRNCSLFESMEAHLQLIFYFLYILESPKITFISKDQKIMVGVWQEGPVNICFPFSGDFNTIGWAFTVLWLKYLPWLLGQGIFYSSMTIME